MNLTEGQWAHITVGSAEDARIAFAHFQYGQREAVDSLIKAMRNHPNLQSLCGLTIDPLNVDPSATFSSSSSSSSLAYSHYPSTSLCMADEGIDDLMAVLLGNDLLFNHTITSINLENNYIMQVGRLALIKAIFSNVTLKSIYYQKQRDPVPLSDIYNDSRRSNILFNADLMLKNSLFLATAESCTGGLIAAACTDLAGSSAWFERGFVSYSNAAKTELLGVDAALIAQHGAVSEPVARAMAFGAIRHSKAQVSVAVTGVAGPTGGIRNEPGACRNSKRSG